MRKSSFFFVLMFLFLQASAGWASENADYLSGLVQRSIEKRLSEKRYWHLLLHYQPTPFRSVRSEAAGEAFFLAPDGETDPQAELEATLAAFFSNEPVGTSKQPAQCAFIARYHWLKEALEIDSSRLPEERCDRFHAWYAALNPSSVTLIFPSAYMNNPSSMFGHTLLRIDQKNQTEQTRILDYTINYAATVTTDNGVLFAVLGIAGGFKGNFSTIPYYIQVQKYSDMENRDIWEYRLGFTEEQIKRMLMHAWELGNTDFTYYFFNKNCSYQLLPLLEVADPELHLTDSFQYWAIPSDTVRLIVAEPGLVKEIVYRPARGTQIRQKHQTLTEGERTLLSRINRDLSDLDSEGFGRLTVERQAFLVDLAYDYTRYQSVADEADLDTIKKKQRILLQRRSAMKVQLPEMTFQPPTAPPEKGHDTARVGFGLGWSEGAPFEALSVRPAYHDLLDDPTGYTSGAQIELMNAEFRYYNQDDRLLLHRLSFANIVSLFPIDTLFKKPSWKVNVGIDSLTGEECGRCRYVGLNVGSGVAAETRWITQEIFYLFVELDGNYGRIFDPRYRAGIGGTIGALADMTKRWRAHLFATYLSYPVGDDSHDLKVSLHQRYTLSKNVALRLDLNRRQDLHRETYQDDALLMVHLYF